MTVRMQCKGLPQPQHVIRSDGLDVAFVMLAVSGTAPTWVSREKEIEIEANIYRLSSSM